MAASTMDSDVEVVDETHTNMNQSPHECSMNGYVPCEICGIKIRFDRYIEHISTHDAAKPPRSSSSNSVDLDACLGKRTRETRSSSNMGVAPTPQRKRAHVLSSRAVEHAAADEPDIELLCADADVSIVTTQSDTTGPGPVIPCDICGRFVPLADFAEHAAQHSAAKAAANSASVNAIRCEICSAFVEPADLTDHMAAHRVHQELLDADLQKSTSDVDITLQIVEMTRNAGSGLPGNRQTVNVGDAVLVRWRDGQWYCAHVRTTAAGAGTFHVTWDPPYGTWASENVSVDAVIPRKNQAREICNFDVALAFVRKLHSFKKDIVERRLQAIEVVYHYTREENVDSIVENNLKVPGERNVDGTKVDVKNGSAYGKGIYAATDLTYGKGFGGGLGCAFLCLAIPGVRVAKQGKLMAPDDSLQQGPLRVYATSEQLLPLFFTDEQQAPRLRECAAKVANALELKLLGLVHAGFGIGAHVEVWWSCGGGWWKAKVLVANANGTYDVSWLPPYAAWAPQYGVAASWIRRSN